MNFENRNLISKFNYDKSKENFGACGGKIAQHDW
jgi:hypothetical protein